VVVALFVIATSVVVPGTTSMRDAMSVRHAAGFMGAVFRAARLDAVSETRAVAVLFDMAEGRWTFRTCVDGNANGVRRADVAGGVDACVDGPHDLGALFPRTRIDVDPQVPGPDGEPGSPDPVRFGRGELASFTPFGTCTAGTLYLRSRSGVQYAVRLNNVTGRMRLLRYDAGARQWVSV
jgi:hypothetical protein